MELAVIGVDGLDPTLVSRWQEDLPTLSRLIENGGFGRLRSTDPPLSSPAWPTLFTGKQGGKHGVFGFTKEAEEGFDRVPVNYSDIQAESLWEALDTSGISCGVVNVPLTYPPSKLDNGFVVSGWPIPNRVTDVTTPEMLLAEIEEAIGESYRVNPFLKLPELKKASESRIREQLCDGLWHHQRAFKYLLEEKPVDVYFCVFMAMDHAGHHLAWDRPALKQMYQEQDEALADLLNSVPDETDILLVSDHGHGVRGNRKFYLNEWLREQGYLSMRSTKGAKARRKRLAVLQQIGFTQGNVLRMKNILGFGDIRQYIPDKLFNFLKKSIPGENEWDYDPEQVDWTETVAYTPDHNVVYLNESACNANQAVNTTSAANLREEIAKKLQDIPHPEKDEPLMSNIIEKPEAFNGPFQDDAPDIVCIADEMRCAVHASFNDGQLFGDKHWGEHRQHGLMITAGPSFTDVDDVPDADIKDVFSLVLGLLNAPIPDNVDGTIPEERLAVEVSPSYRPARELSPNRQTDYSEAESADVREQLKGLGYLE